MDLFTPVVDESRWHKHFRSIVDPSCAHVRKALERWAEGLVDRDGKLVIEFQTTFNSSFWEIYLHAAFRELGFTADYSFSSPDFVLSGPTNLVAEAVIANAPEGFRPESEWNAQPPEDMDEFLRLATVRLANAVSSKHKKYQTSYAGLPQAKDKPFVICVAPFEQPGFFFQNSQAIRRVLYGFDEVLTIEHEGDVTVVGEARMMRAIKDSGVDVPIAYFTDPGMAEVSAVIFSSTATWGKLQARAIGENEEVWFLASRMRSATRRPRIVRAQGGAYSESLLDGLNLLVNPFAKYPLDVKVFTNREIAIHTFDTTRGVYQPWYPEDALLQRRTFGVRGVDEAEVAAPGPEERTYRTQAKPPVEDGKLGDANAATFLFPDNHLGYWKGWTILVVRDETDDDWSAQAIQAIALTVPEFIRINQADENRSFVLHDWYRTKEEAFQASITKVDSEMIGPP